MHIMGRLMRRALAGLCLGVGGSVLLGAGTVGLVLD